MARKEQFNPHHKLGLGVLVIIGITTFVFGIFQINRSIVEPMARKGDFKFKTSAEVEREKEERLKQIDTDGDGLNDYDELYIFRTSPFLEDTDSDGAPDGLEVADSTDPNCPAGRSCRQVRSSEPGTTSGGAGAEPSDLAPDEQDVLDAMELAFGDLDEITPETMRTRLAEMSAEELREFLSKIGVPDEMLQQADDEMMRSLLLETLQEMPESEEGEGTADSE
ncbi:MAG: hypothetical protein U9Q03_01570 [Patescibacteria group bacterium]|nr:hypothetical protein [Patescibacteria group bacterium]